MSMSAAHTIATRYSQSLAAGATLRDSEAVHEVTVPKARRWNVPSRAAMMTTFPSLAHFSANFAMSAQHTQHHLQLAWQRRHGCERCYEQKGYQDPACGLRQLVECMSAPDMNCPSSMATTSYAQTRLSACQNCREETPQQQGG